MWLWEPRIELLGYHSAAPTLRSVFCPAAPDKLSVPAVPALSALGRDYAITEDIQSQSLKRKRHERVSDLGEHYVFRQDRVFKGSENMLTPYPK